MVFPDGAWVDQVVRRPVLAGRRARLPIFVVRSLHRACEATEVPAAWLCVNVDNRPGSSTSGSGLPRARHPGTGNRRPTAAAKAPPPAAASAAARGNRLPPGILQVFAASCQGWAAALSRSPPLPSVLVPAEPASRDLAGGPGRRRATAQLLCLLVRGGTSAASVRASTPRLPLGCGCCAGRETIVREEMDATTLPEALFPRTCLGGALQRRPGRLGRSMATNIFRLRDRDQVLTTLLGPTHEESLSPTHRQGPFLVVIQVIFPYRCIRSDQVPGRGLVPSARAEPAPRPRVRHR